MMFVLTLMLGDESLCALPVAESRQRDLSKPAHVLRRKKGGPGRLFVHRLSTMPQAAGHGSRFRFSAFQTPQGVLQSNRHAGRSGCLTRTRHPVAYPPFLLAAAPPA